MAAIKSEIKTLIENEIKNLIEYTFKIVERPLNREVIGC